MAGRNISIYTNTSSIHEFSTSLLPMYIKMYLQNDLLFAVTYTTALHLKAIWYLHAIAAEQFLQQFAFHTLLLVPVCN